MYKQTIKSEAGQSLADIALQCYGTSSAQALFALVDDNPIFKDGLSSLVPAGSVIKIRADADFADAQMSGYWTGKIVNSTYRPNDSDKGGDFNDDFNFDFYV